VSFNVDIVIYFDSTVVHRNIHVVFIYV